jgi:hypothetical protein
MMNSMTTPAPHKITRNSAEQVFAIVQIKAAHISVHVSAPVTKLFTGAL